MPSDELSLEEQITRAWPRDVWRKTRILIAVSGGADSVALVRSMHRISDRPELIRLAHYNHGWRAVESDRDERFVAELADRLQLPLSIGRAQSCESNDRTPCLDSRSENAAREERYAFLSRIAYETGARYVLTAHTADDRVETLLHNLFRGTGLAGVHSLNLYRELDHELLLVRPLLTVRRTLIEAYLGELNQSYCDDTSNLDTAFRRNFVRHRLLPQIREVYGGGVTSRLLSFSETVAEVDELLKSMAEEYREQANHLSKPNLSAGAHQNQTVPKHHVLLPKCELLYTQWPVVHRALTLSWQDQGWPVGKMTREHWSVVRSLFEEPLDPEIGIGESTRTPNLSDHAWKIRANLPGNLQIASNGNWLLIRTTVK